MNPILTFLIPTLILITAVSNVSAQTVIRDLNGFRLEQLRAATHRELGEPDKRGDTDVEVEFDAFVLNDEPMLYMVFQYRKASPETIWSIQITGDDPKLDPGFRGLRMGMSSADVEKALGKPSKKLDAGDHGTRWEYHNGNYSVEINPQNKLSSIRIAVDPGKEPDLRNTPKFKDVLKTLQTATNVELADLLSPDMELYEGDKVRFFEWRMKNEIEKDTSSMFSTLRQISKELATVDSTKGDQFEEPLRVKPYMNPIFRFPKLKGVTEIAFRWNGERWQIWEFGRKNPKPQPQDWKSIYTPGSLKDLVSKRIPDLIKTPNVAMTKGDGKPLASFSYNSYPLSTRVRFTGETRKTPESTLTLISLWLETIGKPKDIAKRFEFEFKVIEDNKEYWLPIQHPIPERLTKEVKKDDEITIYLAWIGIKYEGDRPDLLAIVNEFAPASK